MSGLGAFAMVIVAAIMLALLGLAVVRRSVPHDRLVRHTDVAGYVYAVIGVLYAVILAQVVVAAWDEYRDARAVAADEANAVLNLARLAEVWPDETRLRIEDALEAYAANVIDVEWPAMAEGRFGPTLETGVMHGLWQAVNDARVRAGNRNPTYAASLEQLVIPDEARRNRVLLGEDAIPEPMRLTLLIGVVVTVAFSYLFAVDDRWLHGLMTAALATLVALLLLLEFQLETPYEGIAAVEPTAMALVRAEIAGGLDANGGQP